MGPELLIPIFAIVGFFASVIVFLYMFYSSRNRERMALIERDKDASIFHGQKNRGRTNALKFGILGVMLGIGIFLGNIIERIGIMDAESSYFSMILIMGGVGLTGFYFLTGNQRHDDLGDGFLEEE